MGLPDEECRKDYFKRALETMNHNLSSNDFKKLAKLTVNYNFENMRNLVDYSFKEVLNLALSVNNFLILNQITDPKIDQIKVKKIELIQLKVYLLL